MTVEETISNPENEGSSSVDVAVAQGGAYEVIRRRLEEQGRELETQTTALNAARLAEFGSTEMRVVGRVRVRTENNCIARDIERVGDYLLFGYNVFIGLKTETRVEDVFGLYRLDQSESGFAMEALPLAGSFLMDERFVREFRELYTYYKHTRLLQLLVRNQTLLASFQIGERLEDVRVFRWSLPTDGAQPRYLDNRGEREVALPPCHDFEWREVRREDSVHGRHPHFNILDTVFVEAVGGNLTIKVENNTEDGLGIYSELVEDQNQSLDDADICYAAVGELILLKIKPYRERHWRYLVFNTGNQQVDRIDEIGEACVQLPENHGIIFPGGYYLQNGENKRFEKEAQGLRFRRMIRSPNGEDVLYVFYEPAEGRVALFAYNQISKTLQNPIFGHGYGLFDDGRTIIFHAEGEEPTRVHPMQVWQTPYSSDDFASQQPTSQSFYGRIGNPELVRGVSDLYSICRLIHQQVASAQVYETLSKDTHRLFDSYHWLEDEHTGGVGELLHQIAGTAELVLDEFEKVETIREQAVQALAEAQREQQRILGSFRVEHWQNPEEYVSALDSVRHQRGHLMTLRDYRYMDVGAIDGLEQELVQVHEKISRETLAFLSRDNALASYKTRLQTLDKQLRQVDTQLALKPLLEELASMAAALDLLSEIMGGLQVEDATVRTVIIDAIADVYAQLNQIRAGAQHREKDLGRGEAVAQFAAQFKLFSQSINNALGLATTPEKCDEQMSRLLVQLEELESQFSGFDEFLSDIIAKREEVYEAFEAHKQQLSDERQRRAQSLSDAADRIIANVQRRCQKFLEVDELNSYFAADALVLKSRELVSELRELGNAVNADDIEARLKAAKEQAVRALRDKSEIFEDGGSVIKLGPRHRFSVNHQELDLTIIPRNGVLCSHLTGTHFYAPITHPELTQLQQYWEQSLPSETAQVYRAEYLAYCLLQDALGERQGLSMVQLHELLPDRQQLIKRVRDYAAPRYKEGYEKGIHDYDAAMILEQLVPAVQRADLLRFAPLSRALAVIFWSNRQRQPAQQSWAERARSACQMQQTFGSDQALLLLQQEVQSQLAEFVSEVALPHSAVQQQQAAHYLVLELAQDHLEFITSKYGSQLARQLKQALDVAGAWRKFQASLQQLQGQPAARWSLTEAWLTSMLQAQSKANSGQALSHYIPEAIAIINAEERVSRRHTEVDLQLQVEGLMGAHPRIPEQRLILGLDEFMGRLHHHQHQVLPNYWRYLEVRQEVIEAERSRLCLEEFKPRPLSSFVRNKLINDAYLPLIGDNLAKQMGTIGDNKRTDLMGLLMMISPPGYGKTTLMEYVANRLGLIFMKINCPSLGHEVLSLDPQRAPNATAKQELDKLNLALEMGNNVMLYLDDIQHTNPEFLQKFISLCDGTRRIEGVWQGQSKTYDMRGRKFCVIMAGNPYTESGELFRIPDMLANRADIYNLGDVLGGMHDSFALSYIENCLTSNAVLAPLATRDMADVYKLLDAARGMELSASDLSHSYSAAEINEFTAVLQKLFVVQEVVLMVNQAYIASAAQADNYRTEPAFKLQGSYRNMNKMAEKVSAVMNAEELQQMIDDHYVGEAQLLTSGAEENLLKLKALRNTLSEEEAQRWQAIQAEFDKRRSMGGDDVDAVTKLVHQLANINQTLTRNMGYGEQLQSLLVSLDGLNQVLATAQYQVEVVNQPVPGMDKVLHTLADTLESSIFPLVKSMEGRLNIDLRTHDKIEQVLQSLRDLKSETAVTQEKHSPVGNR